MGFTPTKKSLFNEQFGRVSDQSGNSTWITNVDGNRAPLVDQYGHLIVREADGLGFISPAIQDIVGTLNSNIEYGKFGGPFTNYNVDWTNGLQINDNEPGTGFGALLNLTSLVVYNGSINTKFVQFFDSTSEVNPGDNPLHTYPIESAAYLDKTVIDYLVNVNNIFNMLPGEAVFIMLSETQFTFSPLSEGVNLLYASGTFRYVTFNLP